MEEVDDKTVFEFFIPRPDDEEEDEPDDEVDTINSRIIMYEPTIDNVAETFGDIAWKDDDMLAYDTANVVAAAAFDDDDINKAF